MTKIDQKRVFDLKKHGLTAFSLVIELAYQVWAISDMQWPEIFWFLIPGVIHWPFYGPWGVKYHSTET